MNNGQIENILYAGVVGDAFGVPVEFATRDSFSIDAMTGGGIWEQPVGSWSDDTSFTLPLIQMLTSCVFDYELLMQKFEDYMYRNEYTPDDFAYGIGNACAKAVRNWSINHYPATECGDPSEFANGNGGLMRIAPLAIYLRNNPDVKQRLQLVKNVTSLTHRHPRAIVGSYLYVEILIQLLRKRDLPSILQTISTSLYDILADSPDEQRELQAYSGIFQQNFAETKRSEVKSSGYVVDTLAASLWSVLNTRTIDEAILLAVNLGDDSDTVASLAGTIASCAHLDQTVDPKWRAQIRNQALLDSIFDPFIKTQTKNE